MSASKSTDPPIDLFRKPTDLHDEESGRSVVPPRGLTDHGLVRTTGWLQLGPHPISSGLITAMVCALLALEAAILLFPIRPVLSALIIPLLPACGYGFWYLLTTRWAPASLARNTTTVAADELVTGMWIRCYGTVGPVGQIAQIQLPASGDPSATVHVTLTGGTTITWSRTHQAQIAELRN